jgi:hypothetical protein
LAATVDLPAPPFCCATAMMKAMTVAPRDSRPAYTIAPLS